MHGFDQIYPARRPQATPVPRGNGTASVSPHPAATQQGYAQAFRAYTTPDAQKIVIKGYSPALLEFLHSLPDSRFHREKVYWTCVNTPAAAWRVRNFPGCRPSGQLIADSAAYGHALACRPGQHLGRLLIQPECRKTDGWQHQLHAFHMADVLGYGMLALGMGAGKSWDAVQLVLHWDCNTTLILCPVSVKGVWFREFNKHAGRPVEVLILDKGTVKEKATQAQRFLAKPGTLPRVIVLNYESAWREDFARFALSVKWDCVILDESHRVAAPNTKVGTFVAKLGQCAKHRLCLTGTPMKQSPLDVFGQFRFLDPGLFGTSWHHFSNRYAEKRNPHIPQQITGYKNLDELQERFSLVSYRVGKEVLDLPPFADEERLLDLPAAARRHYRDLEEEFITEVKEGAVTADNALTRLLRLQQVTSGYLPTEDGRKDVFDTTKAEALSDLLEDCEPPVVVFCRFTHDLQAVQKVACDLHLAYGEVSGSRRDLTPTAELPKDVQVLGVQIQSGGVGIDLSRACYAVYYSLGFSLADYLQSRDRLHRPGQKKPVTYYHLVCGGTVDQRVYGALRQRQNVIEAVLGGYAE